MNIRCRLAQLERRCPRWDRRTFTWRSWTSKEASWTSAAKQWRVGWHYSELPYPVSIIVGVDPLVALGLRSSRVEAAAQAPATGRVNSHAAPTRSGSDPAGREGARLTLFGPTIQFRSR